ncbi:MAG: NAD-binding protein, partial [Desulfobacterales bacterium]
NFIYPTPDAVLCRMRGAKLEYSIIKYDGIKIMVFWILGGGRFGSIAARRLRKKEPDADITIVDSDPVVVHRLKEKADTVAEDGISFLSRQLDSNSRPDWIIATIPVHVAFEWICSTLQDHEVLPHPVPKKLFLLLPNSMRGKKGELYVSQADFLCPDNCPEPFDRCFVTGKPRKIEMYRNLEQLKLPGHRSIVIQSHQLAPGVGGYTPNTLLNARKKIAEKEGRVLVSTACRCQGVLQACEIRKKV